MQHLIEKRTAYTWIEASLENPDKTDPLFKLCWSQASNINKCLKTNVQKKGKHTSYFTVIAVNVKPPYQHVQLFLNETYYIHHESKYIYPSHLVFFS